MKKNFLKNNNIAIILFMMYILTYTSFLLSEKPYPLLSFNLTDYFSTDRILNGLKFNNERILLFSAGIIYSITLLFVTIKLSLHSRLLNYINKHAKNKHISRFFYCFLFLIVFKFLQLPLSILSYLHLKNNGIIITPVLLYFKDFFISTSITITLISVGFIAGIALYEWKKKFFPFMMSLIVFTFSITLMFVYPVFISPLFNDFKPLGNEKLREKIFSLTKKADITVENLYVVDASKRTLSGNAYVSGLGSTKEIVLYDNLLRDFSETEILSIIAHEIKHYKSHHVLTGILIYPVSSPFVLPLLFSILLFFLEQFSIKKKDPSLIIPFFLIALIIIHIFFTGPMIYAASRKMERDADRYSLELTKDPESFISAEIKLATKHSLTNIDPPKLMQFFFSTHPSVKQRIGNTLYYREHDKLK